MDVQVSGSQSPLRRPEALRDWSPSVPGGAAKVGLVMADPISPEVKRFINNHLHGFSRSSFFYICATTPTNP